MPELPEAETIARELNRRLAGRRLGKVYLSRTDIVHGDPRPLGQLLAGRRVESVRRRAKRVILALRPEAELVFALGMTGQITVVRKGEPVAAPTHLRISIPAIKCELRFRDPRRFGGIWCLTGSDRQVGRRLGRLGPEPLVLKPTAFRQLLDR